MLAVCLSFRCDWLCLRAQGLQQDECNPASITSPKAEDRVDAVYVCGEEDNSLGS